jgi:hypothetical protein
MTKPTVVKLFWGSLIGLVAGLVLIGITFALAISNDIFIMSGPDVTGIKSGVLSWTLLGLMGLAVVLLLFAAVAHFVAWIGAVLNTAQLPDKTWFCGAACRWPAGPRVHRHGGLCHRRPGRCESQRGGECTATGWWCSAAGVPVDHERAEPARRIVRKRPSWRVRVTQAVPEPHSTQST